MRSTTFWLLLLIGMILPPTVLRAQVVPPATAVAGPTREPLSPRAIPGITAPDPFPGGCVDCHVERPEEGLDVRISTLMRGWYDAVEPALLERAEMSSNAGAQALAGRHPSVERALGDIPAGCMRCHGAGATKAPPFGKLLHNLHLAGGAENHFLTLFQGECTYCHKLDQDTGTWMVASGPEPSPASR